MNNESYKFTPWYTRADVDFVYVPILRCGHNWAKDYLLENGFEAVSYDSAKDKTRIVIVRDPLERIISGMFAPDDFDFEMLDRNDPNLEEVLSRDPHTSGMRNFIPDDGHTDYVFIKFDIDTDYVFMDFLVARGLDFPPPSVEWTRERMGYSSRHVRSKVVSNNHLTARLTQYLKEDYDWYNSIQWYQ